MKNKYLIQWSKIKWDDEEGEYHVKANPVVRNFTDEELEKFCKDKDKVKVTFLCNIKEKYRD